MGNNEYMPYLSEILEVTKHTEIEYTFCMRYQGEVRPGQFFEVSIPKFGEAPISVSGIGKDTVDLTIRRVGKVTGEIFENYIGDKLFIRGPYGNGFNVEDYKGKELIVVAGGTGLSPVRGVVDYFASHSDELANMTLIAGFKTPADILFSRDLKRWEEAMDVVITVDNALSNKNYKEGLVTEYIPKIKIADKKNAAAVVVGPPPMMRFSTKALLELGLDEENIWISQERKMCCGIGKCGHCRINDVYVCLDGPVFRYTKGKNLID